MYISNITVGPATGYGPGHPAFARDLELRCDPRVNVLIGPNGSGKSSVLRVLAAIWRNNYSANLQFYPLEFQVGDLDRWWNLLDENQKKTFLEQFTPNVPENNQYLIDQVPWAYIPAARIFLPYHIDLPWEEPYESAEIQITSNGEVQIVWPDEWSQLFDGMAVEATLKQLHDHLKLHIAVAENSDTYDLLIDVIKKSYACSMDVAREVLGGQPTNYVSILNEERERRRDFGRNYEALRVEPFVHPGMGAQTWTNQRDNLSNNYQGDLSDGTQGVFLWVLYLALKMMWQYDRNAPLLSNWPGPWNHKPAILLIDEIENHLHPTWQRRVIPALLEHFPRLQIFATTHSPFVVAGLKAGQVHVLKRDENGVVTASTEQRDVIGWTMDEILRGMMGVDDPTDEDTAKAASELRQLRNEGPMADEKEEEIRQQRMLELRAKVDRDLLAGGPLAAQRELFERNLADILEEHRKKQGLNQD